MQLTGNVTILDPASSEYRRMMEIKGSDYQRLTSLPWILWGLDVKLNRAEFWWSQWTQMGVGPKAGVLFCMSFFVLGKQQHEYKIIKFFHEGA